MGGTPWSNSTSTTGPITCTTRPTFPTAAFCVAMLVLTLSRPPPHPPRVGGRVLRFQRTAPRFLPFPSARGPGARDHLDDLLGDGGLADLVHVQRQALDHVVGVVGGRVHGRHARAVLGGRRLQE